jgi:hypothetical protein
MTILIVPQSDVREALMAYPSDFVEGVADLVERCVLHAGARARHFTDKDLRLGGMEAVVVVSPRGRFGVEVEFTDDGECRARVPTVGALTRWDDDLRAETTVVKVGPGEGDRRCFLSDDGEVRGSRAYDAMMASLDGLLGEPPAGFDRDRTLREIADLLRGAEDQKLPIMLRRLRAMM